MVQVCGELYEPSLGTSQEEEDEAFNRSKKAIQLVKVLSGIMPANFGGSEVFNKLITLLKHEDKEIG